jgi:hypothetical protein
VTARRFPFRLEIAGMTVAGVIETEDELDEQLAGREVATPPLPIERVKEPHRGRPSFDSRIAAAVRALGRRIDRRQSRAARALRVLKYLAGTDIEAAAIPKQRTVEDWLAAHEISHGYSRRGKRQPRR